MKRIAKIMWLAFAGIMMACNSSNASNQSEPSAETANAEATAEAANAKDTKKEEAILKPKSDTQVRPDMKVTRPTVIDFNATWCGPCRLFGPAFDKVAEKYTGKVDFYSIDTDAYPQTATAFQIQAIPTIVFMMPDGTVKTHVGLNDFLTTLTNEDASQEELVGTMATELQQMVENMIK